MQKICVCFSKKNQKNLYFVPSYAKTNARSPKVVSLSGVTCDHRGSGLDGKVVASF